jgi:putative SOS response-associated peptidase YedK
MCGRFILTADPNVLQQTFNLSEVPANMSARYNISPSQPIAVITNEHPDKLDFFSWGLVPSWAKDPSMGNKMINARAETAHEKPAFRAAFKRRRCLIPANGFYEWQQRDKGKSPMLIHLDDFEPFAFAGLWEVWHSKDGDEIRSATILTTEANKFMSDIHDRMPVILDPKDYGLWLSDSEELDPLVKLMKPYPENELEAYEVSKLVNKPGNETPECVVPLAS